MRVIQVDFREPSFLERLRPSLYLYGLVAVLFAAQSTRLVVAQERVRHLELERATVARQVDTVKIGEAAVRGLENTLEQSRALRGTNARLALEIAAIGNALAPDLGLTVLRTNEIGQPNENVEIDGITTHISDVARTVRQLSVTGNFELQREDAMGGAISFRLGVNAEHKQAAR